MEPILIIPLAMVALVIYIIVWLVKEIRNEWRAKRQQEQDRMTERERAHERHRRDAQRMRESRARAEKAAKEAEAAKKRILAKAHPDPVRPATLHNQEQLRRAAASPMKAAEPWPELPTERATPLEPTAPLSMEHLEELPFSSRAGYSDTMIFTTPPAEPPRVHRVANRVPPAGQPRVNDGQKAPAAAPPKVHIQGDPTPPANQPKKTPVAAPPKVHIQGNPAPLAHQPKLSALEKTLIEGANEPAPEEPLVQPAQPRKPLYDEHGWYAPTIPGFRRLTPVGSGGMADVFKGEDSNGILRAVKFLRKSRPGETREEELFEREVRLLSNLTSKSIPRLISTHLDAPRPYFVMEYIDGTDLRTYVNTSGPITGGSVLLDLAHSTTEALGEIHANNYLHRDIKPSNIMASRRGFKLIDFGIGKDLDSASTPSGVRMGTLAFMAPEYAGGQQDASRASDVFSWGATLGYAMTGFLPYGPHPDHILVQRVLNGHFDARFLRAVDEIKSRSVTHHMLAYLVGATMRIDPAERDMSFRDMILALRKLRPTD